MKQKGLIGICVTSILMCNCAMVPSAFAVGDSFVEKEPPVSYHRGSETVRADQARGKNKRPDTRWFDAENQKKEYEISTERQLMGLAELVNKKDIPWNVEGTHTFEGVTIKLMRNIELTQPWTPIGSSDTRAFEGRFEGNGHTVSGIEIRDSNNSNAGFFGYLKGSVNNLNLQGSIESKNDNAGGMAAALTEMALIENCTINVNVTGRDRVGGVAGINHSGKIINCHSYGEVEGRVKVGGIVGENWGGSIQNSSNLGQVLSNGKGFGTYGTGGIAGRSVAVNAVIEGCFNQGIIRSSNECVGGVVGYVNVSGAVVRNCYNTGNIYGPEPPALSSYGYVGGIVGNLGENGVIVKNCYHAGTVKNGEYAGGIIGNLDADYDFKEEFSIRNNYYLAGSASFAIGNVGDMSGKSDYDKSAELRSSGDMKSPHMASVLGAAFEPDISGVHGLNKGFPILEWQKTMLSKDYLKSLEALAFSHRRQFQTFFRKHPYGAASGKMILELFNSQMYMERVLSDMKAAKDEPMM